MKPDSILEGAAVLRAFDASALHMLLGVAVDEALVGLVASGVLERSGDQYRITASTETTVMEDLEQRPTALRALRERAAQIYAEQLAGQQSGDRLRLEAAYIEQVQALCEMLIHQDPTALASAVASIISEDLVQPAHRHLIGYYQGLGAGLREQFDAADRIFGDLLAEPDLDDPIRGRVLNSGAVFARLRGDFERARDGYHASHLLWEKLGNRERQGLARMNQGVLSHVLQDYTAAQRELEAALELFDACGATHAGAMAHTNLGLLARDQGRWEQALAELTAAEQLFAKEGARDFLGRVANNIGEVEMLRGRLAEAASHFERALQMMTTRVYTVDVWLNMGLVAQANGDDTHALEYYTTALDLTEELDRRDIAALVRYRIGHAAARLEQFERAAASYAAAIDVIERTRAPMRDEGLLVSLMGRWQQVYEAAILLCLHRGNPQGAFAYAERARARAFADILERRGAEALAESSSPLSGEDAQQLLLPETLLLAYFATGLRGPESALLDAVPRTATGLRACLQTPAELWLFALTKDRCEAHRCALDPNVLQATSSFLTDGRRFLAPRVLRRLHDALIGPVSEPLAEAGRVIIIPHGPLHHLSFTALLDADNRPLLHRTPALCYAPSASVLLRARMAGDTEAPRSCLALGYDGAEGYDLRHTEAEAAAIAALCGGDAWEGSPGVCTRLGSAAGDYRLLHLACHGEFDLAQPLRSALMVGPGEHLSAAEVLTSWNLRADLVVLSACRSGVSHIVRGDEPMGLVRAFLTAGAAMVLVTLWPVEDSSARLFMECFYRALVTQSENSDPAVALRAAQETVRTATAAEIHVHQRDWGTDTSEQAPQSYADPIYWAGYVLVQGRRRATDV